MYIHARTHTNISTHAPPHTHIRTYTHTCAGRKEILDHYLLDLPVASDVDVDALARGTPGMSGAALFNLVNQVRMNG